MSAFDELYVRFFKGAVQCWLNCAAQEIDTENMFSKSDYGFWAGEARAWGRAAVALRPYLSKSRIASLEGAVMNGKFTLAGDGTVRFSDAAAAK